MPLKIFNNNYVYRIARIILGVIFVYASFDKISSPPEFAKIIFHYRMLPSGFENLIAIYFPWIELVTGLLLIIGKFDKASLFIYSVMMIIFLIALSQAQFRGLDIACGCFSVDPSSKSEVWLRIVFDLITLFISVNLFYIVYYKSRTENLFKKKIMINNKIKKILFLVFGLLIVFSFSAFLVSKNLKDPKLSGPVIKFNEEKHEFGDVLEGPQIETVFEFTNTGEDTLKIKNVTTSCGCTGAMMDEKRTFLTGEKGKIRVTFNTQGRIGKNDKTITIESNDLKNSVKTLTISCNIVKQ